MLVTLLLLCHNLYVPFNVSNNCIHTVNLRTVFCSALPLFYYFFLFFIFFASLYIQDIGLSVHWVRRICSSE